MFSKLCRTVSQKREPEYAPLDKRYIEDDDPDVPPMPECSRCKTNKRLLKILMLTHLVLLPAGAAWWYVGRPEPLNKALKAISFYSPLLDRIEIPTTLRFDEPQRLAGGSGDMTWGSEPNPEIDEMWEDITNEAIIPVTEAEVIALKKDPSVAVMLPEEYRINNEKTYLGHALVFHRLHCLDYIRKAVYKDYYYPNGTDEVPMHAQHVAHCMAMILDHLTCAGDPGIYLYQWYEHTEIPLPDANTWGKCWDFKKFRKEFDKVALKDFSPFQLRKPPGAKSVTEHNNLQEIIYKTHSKHAHRSP
ncbi:hypothetical protein C8035_v001987 [Colletotrichum spinosum]|uniref:Cyclochlorotine biosynthesis protein O n=1 Tax=Colletotrichum spinosum TaxID=1347390 RepID=A0A4R8PYB1_9PEZI|nr:hypothetical protein C8035_v001987 [Colletotrichum spinosum]